LKRVEIKKIKEDTLKAVLDFLYTGSINITSANVENVSKSAREMEIERKCLFVMLVL